MQITDHSLHLSESVEIEAAPQVVYALVTDVTRMGARSPECTDATWTDGEPGSLGARFVGTNQRGDREWQTECEVVVAEPPHRFAWAVLTSAPDKDISVWTYEIEPTQDGCRLTERYEMSQPPPPLQRLIEKHGAENVLPARSDMLSAGMRATLDAIRAEAQTASGLRQTS